MKGGEFSLISTWLQPGVGGEKSESSRFSGFCAEKQAVETAFPPAASDPGLKPGANEIGYASALTTPEAPLDVSPLVTLW